jgi:3-oxoadipate enol-lactonase
MPTARANGIELHYRFDGPEDGVRLVFTNSLFSRLEMWDAQIAALTGAGYRVLRYDARGHGRSEAPDGPYSIEMLADDLAGLMDAVGWERAHICGLSMGGMVGQMMGTRYPDRVRALILCDTSAYMGAEEVWEPRVQTGLAEGVEGLVESSVTRWFTPESMIRLPDEVEKVRAMIRATPLAGFIGCCRAFQSFDHREANRTITAPTLVIVGEHDPGTPPSHARVIRDAIPGAELAIIEDAAHLTNIEAPERFNATLLDFLARAAAPR